MKAYYKNGNLYIKNDDRRERTMLICIISIAIMFIIIVMLIFTESTSENADQHTCGITIPGIENHTFCIAYDNQCGTYYYNDKFEIKIK